MPGTDENGKRLKEPLSGGPATEARARPRYDRPASVAVAQSGPAHNLDARPTPARSWYAMGKSQLSYVRLISVPAMSAWVRLVVIRAKISSRVLLRES